MNWTKILTVVLKSSPIWVVALGILYAVWRGRKRRSATPAPAVKCVPTASQEGDCSAGSGSLVCDRCGIGWSTGIWWQPLLDERKAAAWRARRCLTERCNAPLRRLRPGEKWNFWVYPCTASLGPVIRSVKESIAKLKAECGTQKPTTS